SRVWSLSTRHGFRSAMAAVRARRRSLVSRLPFGRKPPLAAIVGIEPNPTMTVLPPSDEATHTRKSIGPTTPRPEARLPRAQQPPRGEGPWRGLHLPGGWDHRVVPDRPRKGGRPLVRHRGVWPD